MKPMFSTYCALLIVLMTACQSNNVDATLAEGSWGGQGIGMVVEQNRVGFEFDCALAEITQVVTLKDNRFSVEGTFSKLQGGAVTIDWKPTPEAATFEGTLNGTTLTLSVVLKANKTNVGTFTVKKDSQPVIRRCM